ncbi:MAG: CPBP family intramembrane metalloprotease, partial [Propionibacteriaceae bacterium]|nr:CPBP family intramembrane metalloprotease [Propionibacteriaceae bacterium]
IPGVPTPNRPLGAAFLFGNIALLLPALALALLIGERRTIGTMSSVAGRLRRGLLGRYLGLAAAIVAVTTTASAALTLATGTPMTPQVTPWTLGLLAVTFLLIPLQATAEEYVFRGLPQQMLGSWLKSPWWGILVPIPLFAFAHLYNALGLISTALFALAAGILTWRTGGLEAAIGLHVVNNLVAIGMGAFAITDLAATEVTPASLITSTIATVSYTALVLRGRKTPARGTT